VSFRRVTRFSGYSEAAGTTPQPRPGGLCQPNANVVLIDVADSTMGASVPAVSATCAWFDQTPLANAIGTGTPAICNVMVAPASVTTEKL
jgi:hypothetical protein